MLTLEVGGVWATDIATARAVNGEASLIALAADALDRSLALNAGRLLGEAPLVVFAGAVFGEPRRNSCREGSLTPLLDNEFGARACRELLFERGLLSSQLYGVLLAEGTAFVSGLEVGCGLMLAERLAHVLVVAVEVAAEVAIDGPVSYAPHQRFATAAACRLTSVCSEGLVVKRLLRCSTAVPSDVEACFTDHLSGGRRFIGSLAPPSTAGGLRVNALLADRVQALVSWQQGRVIDETTSCMFVEHGTEQLLAATFECAPVHELSSADGRPRLSLGLRS